MNDYFTKPVDLAPQTKARSVDINNLSQLVLGAFDKLPSESQLKKGTVNYAVDTGAVNAIVASINPASILALTDGLEVRVKVAFANTAAPTLNLNALGAVAIVRNDGLPIQAGDIPAGIVRFAYNATLAKWTYSAAGPKGDKGDRGEMGLSGVGSDAAALSGSQVMTAASPGALRFTPTAPGQSVTLPNATTIVEHAFLYSLENVSPYDYWIKDFAGSFLGVIHPGDVVRVSNIDNATPAGSWSLEGADCVGVEAEGDVTLVAVLPLNGGTAAVVEALALDANRTLLILAGRSSVSAVVHDQSTNTFGPSAWLLTGDYFDPAQGKVCACMTATANTAMVILGGVGTNPSMRAFVLSVAGTAITVGAPVDSPATAGNCIVDAIALVGDTIAVVARDVNGQGVIGGVTFAGTTPAWGGLSIGATSRVAGAALLPMAGGVLAVTIGAAGVSCISARFYSIAGNTLTPGTGNQTLNASTINGIWAKLLPTGRVAIGHHHTSAYRVTLLSVAGSVLSASNLLSTGIDASEGAVVASGAQLRILGRDGSSNLSKITVVTDNAGTLVQGATVSLGLGSLQGAPLGMVGNEAWFEVPHQINATETNLTIVKVGVSGNDPVVSYQTNALPTNTSGNISYGGVPLNQRVSAPNVLVKSNKAYAPNPTYGRKYDAAGTHRNQELRVLVGPWAPVKAAGTRESEAWCCYSAGGLTVKLQKLRLV